ncbi:aconitase X swivel domain-containing protein [Bordetella sp. H567]|uniref:aconitase X swivel domain-containing protein n=1 Tax=Bordetella sp. H567 TaxID=1697043 RepID=UPI001912572A|nr:DUF126 domain-containing protein [Bordetella sp. H567]
MATGDGHDAVDSAIGTAIGSAIGSAIDSGIDSAIDSATDSAIGAAPGGATGAGVAAARGVARAAAGPVSSASCSGIAIVPGIGAGGLLVLDEPLSFWGGYDAQAGTIVEPRHPQFGLALRGTFLLMARAKGSSSSSSVLAEAIRNGTGPAAIVMRERDLIVALGCIVASELYGVDVPIAVVDEAGWQALAALPPGTPLRLEAGEARCDITAGTLPS